MGNHNWLQFAAAKIFVMLLYLVCLGGELNFNIDGWETVLKCDFPWRACLSDGQANTACAVAKPNFRSSVKRE